MEKLMNGNEFEEYVCSTVKAALTAEQADAKVSMMHDGNGGVVMRIDRPWSNIYMQFPMDSVYENYLKGKITAESVVAKVLNSRKLYHVLPYTKGENIFNFERAKERIVSSRMPIKDRPVIYSETMAFATIWELHISDLWHERGTQGSIPVTWDLMNAWGISVNELARIARRLPSMSVSR